jgi:DNA mismatch endonuclease (patch repair protein)
MADIVDKATRSRMMSGIRAKHTRPEILVRKGLFSRGFRYRIHARRLPGKPDVVLPKYKAVILIHGCFWHKHNCHLFKMPSTNRPFWKKKFEANRNNDKAAVAALRKQGWRVLSIWECSLKGKSRLPEDILLDKIEKWIRSDRLKMEITGDKRRIKRHNRRIR